MPDDAEFAALGKAIHECKTLHEDSNAPKLDSSDRHYTAKSIEAAENVLAVVKKQVQQIKDNAAKVKPETEPKDEDEAVEAVEDEPESSHELLLLDDDKRLITAIQVNYDNIAKIVESHLANTLGCEPRQVLDIQELVNNQKANVIRQVTRMMDKHHQANVN